jgi:hypothetical protein
MATRPGTSTATPDTAALIMRNLEGGSHPMNEVTLAMRRLYAVRADARRDEPYRAALDDAEVAALLVAIIELISRTGRKRQLPPGYRGGPPSRADLAWLFNSTLARARGARNAH